MNNVVFVAQTERKYKWQEVSYDLFIGGIYATTVYKTEEPHALAGVELLDYVWHGLNPSAAAMIMADDADYLSALAAAHDVFKSHGMKFCHDEYVDDEMEKEDREWVRSLSTYDGEYDMADLYFKFRWQWLEADLLAIIERHPTDGEARLKAYRALNVGVSAARQIDENENCYINVTVLRGSCPENASVAPDNVLLVYSSERHDRGTDVQWYVIDPQCALDMEVERIEGEVTNTYRRPMDSRVAAVELDIDLDIADVEDELAGRARFSRFSRKHTRADGNIDRTAAISALIRDSIADLQ